MEEPNFIYETSEGIHIPFRKQNIFFKIYTIMAWFVIVVAILECILHTNLIVKMPMHVQAMLFIMAVCSVPILLKGVQPSDIEFHIYNDYFILYRRESYCKRISPRMEYNKFYYRDIEKCVYDKRKNTIEFHGMVEKSYYNYKNGIIPLEPTYHKFEKDVISFRIFGSSIDDISDDTGGIYERPEEVISNIERFLGLKVQVKK